MNINTKEHWDRRFATGDWEAKQGRVQTRLFAEAQVRHLGIPADFSGTLMDFGCGCGDAMPVYRRAFRYATLVGMDISEAAIAECRKRYGDMAQFIPGDQTQVPEVDVIIASNVFEHLSNDVEIAKHLLTKCTDLYITVPYRESLYPGTEHVNSYDEHYFRGLGAYNSTVFAARGWSQYGWSLWCNVCLKNVLRLSLGRKTLRRRRQIMFHFINRSPLRGHARL